MEDTRAGGRDSDVTLDCIALARSQAAWERADYQSVRTTLAASAQRLAQAGADFFACPDNTAHVALEQPGASLPLPGLNIAEVVADQAASNGHMRVGLLCTKETMDGPVIRVPLRAAGSPPDYLARTTARYSTRSSSPSC